MIYVHVILKQCKKKRIYNKKYTLFMVTDASGMMLTAGFPSSLLACLENDPF